MMTDLVLVNKFDNVIGKEEKLKAHKEGKLHRAFSILIFNSKNELLLQKRASSKYHSGGLWTNTCCSHPMPNEVLEEAIHRRLKEEMGFDTELKELFSFSYTKKFDNGLIENEIDHVFIGFSNEKPKKNTEEFEDFKYIKLSGLIKDMKNNLESYTYWFREIILNKKNFGALKDGLKA
ncbi:MAG: isopentenyl-diphosphate Delta-isomerase [Candidatus Nanoarchaeia archaeon]|nr:isopentenyl-diphosphate Delta-isomerase [Candidatus Nanoarchaeia archaeon]